MRTRAHQLRERRVVTITPIEAADVIAAGVDALIAHDGRAVGASGVAMPVTRAALAGLVGIVDNQPASPDQFLTALNVSQLAGRHFGGEFAWGRWFVSTNVQPGYAVAYGLH